jgi:hypothetical protein
MKSGRYYKIGRSNTAGRRECEVAIQMPEKLVTVPTIRTGDPQGSRPTGIDASRTKATGRVVRPGRGRRGSIQTAEIYVSVPTYP